MGQEISFAQVSEAWVAYSDTTVGGATNIAVDAAGNIYVTGGSYHTIKYDTSGSEQWSRSTLTGTAMDLALDSAGYVYITGTGGTVKYDPVGNVMWSYAYPLIPPEGRAIAVDESGNSYVAGVFDDDYATVKYDQTGSIQWYRFYDGPVNGSDEALALYVDAVGNIYVTGFSEGTTLTGSRAFDFATIAYNTYGSPLWTARYNGTGDSHDIAVDITRGPSESVYVTGSSMGITTGNDFATIQYDTTGTENWVKRLEPSAYIRPNSLSLDSEENIYVTGTNYVVKYLVNGIEDWAVSNDGTYYDSVVDSEGNVYVTGERGNNYLTVKYNTMGGKIWEIKSKSDCIGSSKARGIALDADNNVYVTGSSKCNLTSRFMTIKYEQDNTTTLFLNIEKLGNSWGTVNSDPPVLTCDWQGCTGIFEVGSEVTLTPTHYSDSYFKGWSGDCSGTDSCTITMDAEKSVVATFDEVPHVFIDDALVSEKPDGSSEAKFYVTLPRTITQPVTVDFHTSDGTALEGIDYTASSGTLTFSPGEYVKSITVEIPGSLSPSGDKTFFVNLGSETNTNAYIEDGQGLATISAISPEFRGPDAVGHIHYHYYCTIYIPPVCLVPVFEMNVINGDIHVYQDTGGGSEHYDVGVAEFDVSSIPPGIDRASLNLFFEQYDAYVGFAVSYLTSDGNGMLDTGDYYNCQQEDQRVYLDSILSADQKRIDITDALRWATTNLTYLTICFHGGVEEHRNILKTSDIFFAPSDDLDLDGIFNGTDNCLRTPNTEQADNDQDGQGDACDDDDDNDGLTDEFEIAHNLNPFDEDMDDDGLSDYEEVCYDGDCESYDPGTADTDANNPDTDGGGKSDYLEVMTGSDALDQWDDIVTCTAPVKLTNTYFDELDFSMNSDGTGIAYTGCDQDFFSISCGQDTVIYLLEFRDGAWQAPVQISSTTTWNFSPSISADGSKIAYLAGYDVYIVEYKDGQWQAPVKLTDTNSARGPFMNADGTRIFYYACDGDSGSCTNGDYEIYVVEFDGASWQTPERLTDNAADDYNPVPTPDGNRVVYTGCDEGTDKFCTDGSWGIYFTEFTGGSWQTPILVGANAFELPYRASITDDGEKILYSGKYGPYNLRHTYLVEYINGSWQAPVDLIAGGTTAPYLNADGTRIFLGLSYYELRDGVWLGPAGLHIGNTAKYAYSSDGMKIAFSEYVDRGDFDNYDIHIMECVSQGIDSDRDGIFDDGDWSGIMGDNYCAGQTPAYCDDNCPDIPNSDQTDTDGDGIGDVCETDTLLGDINGDGYVNVVDVIRMMNMIVGNIPIVATCADVNEDNNFNVADVVMTMNMIVGNTPFRPCYE